MINILLLFLFCVALCIVVPLAITLTITIITFALYIVAFFVGTILLIIQAIFFN